MNDVQADKSDYLGTKLARVLGGEAAALNTLLAKLRPYLHCLVREQFASAERYQDHGSGLGQETSVRFYIDLGISQSGVGPFRVHGRHATVFHRRLILRDMRVTTKLHQRFLGSLTEILKFYALRDRGDL